MRTMFLTAIVSQHQGSEVRHKWLQCRI